MNLSGCILRMAGWKVEITAPRRNKCVICVAPHTSNYDFILGILAYKSLGRKANFLIKDSWFFFPLNLFFKSLGGIPVSRKKSSDLTSRLIADFASRPYLNLAVTPEGTRSGKTQWHTGFLRIAKGAQVPVQLGIIDYKKKKIIISREFTPGSDTAADLAAIKAYYRNYGNCARFPEKFIIS